MDIVIEGPWDELEEINEEISDRYSSDQLTVTGIEPVPVDILRPRRHGQVELYQLGIEFAVGFSANLAANLATDYLRDLRESIRRKRDKPVEVKKGKEILERSSTEDEGPKDATA